MTDNAELERTADQLQIALATVERLVEAMKRMEKIEAAARAVVEQSTRDHDDVIVPRDLLDELRKALG